MRVSAAGEALTAGELWLATGASVDVQTAVARTSQATVATDRYRVRRSGADAMVRNRTRYDGSVASDGTLGGMARRDVVDDTAAWRQDPDRQTSLLFDVFVLGQRTRALVAEAMRDAGMRPDEYAAYSVVFEAGPLTQTDLAERLGMAITTVADHVRTMVERRHLRRRPHPTDQRAALLALTPEGIRAHRRAARSFEVAARAMSDQLSPLKEGAAREVLQRLTASAERALGSMPARRAG